MEKLNGKIALVTGGSNGIGFATAQRFVAEGAYVYITGRRQVELDAAVKKIGRNIAGIQGDVSKIADLERLYTQIKQEKSRLDVLFANAGVYEMVPLAAVDEVHFDRMFDINVKGLLFTVQKALPLMGKNSSIILNGSVVSIKGFPAASVYSATKGAVRSFARTWSSDLKEQGIRVNVVSPGPVLTEGTAQMFGSQQGSEMTAGMLAGIPRGRLGEPDDIAKAVSFLASDDSLWITGLDLFVDGGLGQI